MRNICTIVDVRRKRLHMEKDFNALLASRFTLTDVRILIKINIHPKLRFIKADRAMLRAIQGRVNV